MYMYILWGGGHVIRGSERGVSVVVMGQMVSIANSVKACMIH